MSITAMVTPCGMSITAMVTPCGMSITAMVTPCGMSNDGASLIASLLASILVIEGRL